MLLQGLSHYLEHMLFMGSAKFPDENSYDAFLSAHAGSSNAYTELVRCSKAGKALASAAPDLTLVQSLAGNAWSCAGSLLPMLSARVAAPNAYTQLVCWGMECGMSGAPQLRHACGWRSACGLSHI